MYINILINILQYSLWSYNNIYIPYQLFYESKLNIINTSKVLIPVIVGLYNRKSNHNFTNDDDYVLIDEDDSIIVS